MLKHVLVLGLIGLAVCAASPLQYDIDEDAYDEEQLPSENLCKNPLCDNVNVFYS